MAGEHLHAFDLELCDYAVGQLRSHLRTLRERPRPPFPALDYDAFHRETTAEWLGRGVAGLPELLADHVWAGVTGEPVAVCLNDSELTALAGLVDDPPLRCEGDCVWVPCPALHQRYVLCLVEIRSELSQATAEAWASQSLAFAARLSEDELPLVHGFDAVHEWLWALRQLLAAMNAVILRSPPHDDRPTPTVAAGVAALPPGLDCTQERFHEVLTDLRRAIQELPDGKTAIPDAVIAQAEVNRQLGRRALRWLESHGEYNGFAKKKPARYSRKD
jgi:hypothetical protein